MIHLYAIVDGPRVDLAGQRGLEDLPLFAIHEGPVIAVASDHDSVPRPTMPALLRHERVVDALMARHTVVPARFSADFSCQAALQSVLSAEEERLGALLRRLEGRVELALRLRGAQAPRSQFGRPASGRQYLEQLRGGPDAGASEQAARSVYDRLADHAVDSTIDPSQPGAVTAAFLVDAAGTRAFQRLADRLLACHTGLHGALTGPWPAYSFVGADVAATEPARAL